MNSRAGTGFAHGRLLIPRRYNFAKSYKYTPVMLRGAAVGLFSLLRNEGGSLGTSLAQTLHERRDQFHALRLGESLDPFNPNLNDYFAQAQAFSLRQTGDPVAVQQMATQAIDSLRDQQSSSLAYFDVFCCRRCWLWFWSCSFCS